MPFLTMDLQHKGDWPATHLTILDVGLVAAGQVQGCLNVLPTIGTFIMSAFQHRGLPGDLCV
ncbi:hypothetical protein AK973_5211 [Pseudomonas brassicacearum]|nr:hypothetical protein AK973_5211 [Pseudomonas brassicacearum]